MLIVLEEFALGGDNRADVTPNVFICAVGFRKFAYVMVNKPGCTFKDGAKCHSSASDIWKRMVVGRKVDLRRNFGQTSQVSIEKRRKVQHYNYEEIPVIERRVSSEDPKLSACAHIERRILAFVAVESKLVPNTELVN